MSRLKLYCLVISSLLVTACSEKKAPETAAPAEAPKTVVAPAAVTPSAPAPAPATAAPSGDAKETGIRNFVCGPKLKLEVHDFDDGSARVSINSLVHTLRPANVEQGSLYQGDNVGLRIVDGVATASENGIVLFSGCKAQPG